WGDPMQRETARVLEDFLDGYVTIAEARDNYGVVIDSRSRAIDGEATKRTRADHHKAEAVAAAGR
ncbi:MAG: hydantoinase B/oxoprolinase family protein, partial [Bryobacteraceae bacterium]